MFKIAPPDFAVFGDSPELTFSARDADDFLISASLNPSDPAVVVELTSETLVGPDRTFLDVEIRRWATADLLNDWIGATERFRLLIRTNEYLVAFPRLTLRTRTMTWRGLEFRLAVHKDRTGTEYAMKRLG